MVNFVAELKRRHIYRVGAAYAVVAWVLLQLVTNVAPVLDLPIWVARAFLLALIVGFPITLLFAWMRELAPADGTTPQAATGKSDWVLAGGLAVIIALVSYQQLATLRGERAVPVPPAGVEAARTAASIQAGVSIAVLPFDNLSGDAAQEFFSDGMTEEITTALAKVPDLRVVGRTSAYQFKGKSQDLRAIGQALSVTHLIEGSVRKAGDRVRITAQLIKVDDGTHIWAENYDRQLIDIFAIQEEIARAIAAAMRMPLGLKPGENLLALRPKDEQTYDLFLRGRAAFRVRNCEALELLKQVVARDPNFAPGWVWFARAMFCTDEKERQRLGGMEAAARKAIALAPDYSGGYGVLATNAADSGKWLEAIDLFKQGLARDPDDPEILNGYSLSLRALGYLKEALAVSERVHLLEPLIPVYNFLRAELLAANGMQGQAIREWLAIRPSATNGSRLLLLAPAYAQLGRFDDAIDVVLHSDLQAGPGRRAVIPKAETDAAVAVLRAAADNASPPAELPDFRDELGFIYAYTSTPERVLDFVDRNVKAGQGVIRYVWWPVPSSVRKTERFKTLMRNAGFVDVWRVRGWPDHCHPVGADDFACE